MQINFLMILADGVPKPSIKWRRESQMLQLPAYSTPDYNPIEDEDSSSSHSFQDEIEEEEEEEGTSELTTTTRTTTNQPGEAHENITIKAGQQGASVSVINEKSGKTRSSRMRLGARRNIKVAMHTMDRPASKLAQSQALDGHREMALELHGENSRILGKFKRSASIGTTNGDIHEIRAPSPTTTKLSTTSSSPQQTTSRATSIQG